MITNEKKSRFQKHQCELIKCHIVSIVKKIVYVIQAFLTQTAQQYVYETYRYDWIEQYNYQLITTTANII